jgi:hypothetical protein
MRLPVIAAFVATASLLQLPAVAEDAKAEKTAPPTAAAEQPVKAQADSAAATPELVCRMEQETGSRFKTKVCRPRAAVDADARESERLMQDAQRAGARTTAQPGR